MAATISMKNTFHYEQASALLPAVRDRTCAVVKNVEPLYEDLSRTPQGSPRWGQLKGRIDSAVQEWANEILALGALPKGIWNVDFDSGEGYFFCWSFDEDDLSHYHLYDDGFDGRKALTEVHRAGESPLLLN